MSSPLMHRVDSCATAAISEGALVPIDSTEFTLESDGLSFRVRLVKALQKKQELPGGPRDPDFNPFLPPEPALTVGPVGAQHVAILNKYPVSARHLVLARSEYLDQQTPLDIDDFRALAHLLSAAGGLGFHNGGAPAGASQKHKHVQWIPAADGNAGLGIFRAGLTPDAREHTVFIHLQLPMRHCFVKVQAGIGVDEQASAASMLEGYRVALAAMGLEADEAGHMPPSNMLVEDGWMLLVPRSKEHFAGVSINALSFGGVFYVKDEQQVEAIRNAGPLEALESVACPV